MLDGLFDDLTSLRLWIIVLILSAIGIIEKTVIFYAGERKGDAVLDDLPGLTPGRKEQMKKLSERWGSIIMILASIPLVGSAVTAVSGIGHARRATFFLLVVISYLIRNWLIIILSGQVLSIFSS
jgi:membrane protein DedA with SNARE-associated domain